MDINVTIEVNVRVMWPSEINSLTFRPPALPSPFSNDPQPTFLVTNEFFEYLIYAHLLMSGYGKQTPCRDHHFISDLISPIMSH